MRPTVERTARLKCYEVDRKTEKVNPDTHLYALVPLPRESLTMESAKPDWR
jgi:hypothetical protein